MAEKSRLAEILGVEEDEEFRIKGSCDVYRIHDGKREYKDTYDDWQRCVTEAILVELINDPSLIIRKPRFTDEEMTFLRLLHKYGKVRRISRRECATYIAANVGELLKPGENIDLDEMFKEGEDGD